MGGDHSGLSIGTLQLSLTGMLQKGVLHSRLVGNLVGLCGEVELRRLAGQEMGSPSEQPDDCILDERSHSKAPYIAGSVEEGSGK